MKSKEYIGKIRDLIIARVKYHAPQQTKDEMDFSLLQAMDIDEKYPIFLYKKPLDKTFFRAFFEAKKLCQFNLILTEKPLVSIKKLTRTYLLLSDEIGINLNNLLNNLNVNYASKTDYKIERNYEFLKINNQEIKFEFLPFYNYKKLIFDGVICDIKEFLLNGKNYAISLVNTRDKNNLINIELNIPLPQGYYLFKKKLNSIKIQNLTNKNTAYFNYLAGKNNINFSCLDGLSSCTFACINFCCQIELRPKQKKELFFSFGDEELLLDSQKDIQNFFNISQNQMFEIFDTRIMTRDQKEDALFNLELPKKVWNSWNNFSYDEISENRYLAIKNSLIKKVEGGLQVTKELPNLREVKIYHNGVWKRVFIVHGQSTYLFAGRTKYCNYTLLSNEVFDKNNEIYLSFAN